MRIDVISIFPAYLDPLRLSLVGKAGNSGVVPLGCTTSVTGPTTDTARSTTPRTAAGRAW